MGIKIPEFLQGRKAREAALLAAVLLAVVAAFGLGRLSVASLPEPVALCTTLQTALASRTEPDAASAQAQPARAPAASLVAASARAAPATGGESGAYVASKNGGSYHLPWCSGAKRIKEENKVYFASKEEAEAAGYKPASNCKGI